MSDINVYEPNRDIMRGFFPLFRIMFKDLISGSELGIRLFKRDFSAKYRQSLLGVLWVVLMPIFTVAVFLVLNLSGVLNVGDIKVPYVVFALYGLTVWNLFTGCVTNLSGTIYAAGSLITKINFTRISLAYAPILTAFVDFGIRVLLLIIVMVVTGTVPNFKLLPLACLSLLPLVLLSVGLGLFLTIVGAVFKDLPNILTIAFNFLMFISPVVYPLSGKGRILGAIAKYNPLTSLLNFPRNLLFFGDYSGAAPFLIVSGVSLLIFLAGWRFYHISITRIVEKV